MWECLPNHVCRLMAPGQQRDAPRGAPGFQPFGYAAQPPNFGPVGFNPQAAPPVNPWAPQAPVETEGDGALPSAQGAMMSSLVWSLRDREVWCARHGKRILKASSVKVNDAFYVCSDPAVCTATPLEPVETLIKKGCQELLCGAHERVRSVQFLVVDTVNRMFVCNGCHSCHTSGFKRDARYPTQRGRGAVATPSSSFFPPVGSDSVAGGSKTQTSALFS